MRSRMIFGFLLLLMLGILIGVIALGKVEEKTSYGLLNVITILGMLAGQFSQWAFGSKDDDKKPPVS